MSNATVESGLRERKKQRTRAAIHRAAFEAFLRRGFDAATIDDIAAGADVARRTFFRYFESKEAVVFADHHERIARFRVLLDDRARGESPFGAVRRALVAVGHEYSAAREDMVAQHRIIESSPALVAKELELDRDWEGAMAAALGRGLPRTAAVQRRARIVAGATIGAIRVALREWFATEGRADLVALGEQALDVVEAGAPELFRRSLAS